MKTWTSLPRLWNSTNITLPVALRSSIVSAFGKGVFQVVSVNHDRVGEAKFGEILILKLEGSISNLRN